MLNDFRPELWDNPSIHKILARAMANGEDFKFTVEHLEASKPLEEWARYIVDNYVGSFEFMVSLVTQQRMGKELTLRQLRGALNVLLRAWRESLLEVVGEVGEEAVKPVDISDRPHQPSEVVDLAQVKTRLLTLGQVSVKPHDGTYTFVHNHEYRVLRFDTHEETGAQFVSYQCGSDNETAFARCGKIEPDGKMILWGAAYSRGEKISLSVTQRADLKTAIEFLCGMGSADQLKAGEAYALKSARCFVCHRPLTVPSSISDGMGPICAEKWTSHFGL